MFGSKIRLIREIRGYSQMYMSEKIGIAQNTYSKIESNHIRLSTEMLQNISNILEISPMDIMNPKPAIINFQHNKNMEQEFLQEHSEIPNQKELYELLIDAKNSEIDNLKKIIESLIAKK